MSGDGRRPDGKFAPGHKFGKGRPPRNYSIAHAMSIAAEQPQSVDDDGNPLTDAQLAARWLWRVVREGRDYRADEALSVSTKDRLSALQTILSRIEPEYKLKPEDMANEADERAEEAIRKLESLSEADRAKLKELADKVGQ